MKLAVFAVLFAACAFAQKPEQASFLPQRMEIHGNPRQSTEIRGSSASPVNASRAPRRAIVPVPPGSSCQQCAQCNGWDWWACVAGFTPACWTDCYAGIAEAKETPKGKEPEGGKEGHS